VEDYAIKWTKREKEEVDTVSVWVKAVRSRRLIPYCGSNG
jgi:hypothetical protein